MNKLLESVKKYCAEKKIIIETDKEETEKS